MIFAVSWVRNFSAMKPIWLLEDIQSTIAAQMSLRQYRLSIASILFKDLTHYGCHLLHICIESRHAGEERAHGDDVKELHLEYWQIDARKNQG